MVFVKKSEVFGHIIQHSETDCAEINVYISNRYIYTILTGTNPFAGVRSKK